MKTPNSQDPLAAFGNALRQRREALGMSQEKLAAHAGVHRNYLGGIERGERNVALRNLVKIAHALGLSLQVLIKDARL